MAKQSFFPTFQIRANLYYSYQCIELSVVYYTLSWNLNIVPNPQFFTS